MLRGRSNELITDWGNDESDVRPDALLSREEDPTRTSLGGYEPAVRGPATESAERRGPRLPNTKHAEHAYGAGELFVTIGVKSSATDAERHEWIATHGKQPRRIGAREHEHVKFTHAFAAPVEHGRSVDDAPAQPAGDKQQRRQRQHESEHQ